MAPESNHHPATIASRLGTRDNNFDIMRLAAAILVIASHSYPMAGRNGREPFFSKWGGYDSGGGIAVAIFFVISGFLVTRSVTQRSVGSFVRSRILRILPGLAVLTFVEVLVFGPLFTKLSLAEYFSSTQTWRYLRNVRIFGMQPTLPGLFESHPQPGINVSLWTIPVECFCYLLLPIFLLLGLLERRILLGVTVLTAGFYVYAVSALGLHWGNQGWKLVEGVHTFVLLKFGLFFLSGALLYLFRERVPLDPWLAFIACVLLVIAATGSLKFLVYHLALPYLVVFAAFYKKWPVPWYEKLGDISYGTYLYGSPVQQSLVAVFGQCLSPSHLTLLSVPIVLIFGALSWIIVERRFLNLRGR